VQNCRRSKNRTFTVVILFFFEGGINAFSARNELNKVIMVDGSSNAGVWGLHPPEVTGGSEAKLPMLK